MKLTKIIAAGLSALMCFPLFAACGEQTETVYQAATELSYYDGTHYEELADPYKPYYNKELWRRNSSDLSGADPLVLDNTSRDGYYYAYVTGLTYSRSEDLVTWESGGSFVSFPEELSGSDALWAPEVIYDEEDELYYAFFTVNPPADKTAGEGESAPYYMPIVATSEKASGPFVPVAFDDRNTSYPQSYAKYALFDNASYMAAFEASGVPDSTSGNSIYTVDRGYVDGDAGWVRCIDFSPYINPDTGEKYLYWSQTPGAIAGVKMTDWLTPDWSTYETLTACGFYTVDDYVKYMNGETVDGVYYEEMASYCNEGPFMIKHNGKYYLTFSIGSYLESSYGVMQAVSDSPLGPFRKLTDEENGMILSNDLGENHAVGGPGHHSFFTVSVDGQQKLMIAYHAHTNLYTYEDRAVRFDEVKWVTVEGADGQPLDVMHVNGPTVTTQPSFGIGGEYGDISGAMESIQLIRGELAEGSSAERMIDGLFSCFTVCSQAFEEKYAAAASIVQTSTFEIALESPRELRGIMFYNSNSEETMFESIRNIAFVCEENGQEKVYLIPELNYSSECNSIYNIVTGQYYTIFGGGCYAEFASLANVKAIRFTVEVPEGKESVGVAEVALVGKFADTQA